MSPSARPRPTAGSRRRSWRSWGASHHLFDLRPAHRAATDVDVFFVEIDGEGEAEVAQDGIGEGVNAFPAVIHGDDDGFFGDVLLALLPRHDIAERDDGDLRVFDGLHLIAELGGGNQHGAAAALAKIVIAEDGDDGGLIELEGGCLGHFWLGCGGCEHGRVLQLFLDGLFFGGQHGFSGLGRWWLRRDAALLGKAAQLVLDAFATRQRAEGEDGEKNESDGTHEKSVRGRARFGD